MNSSFDAISCSSKIESEKKNKIDSIEMNDSDGDDFPLQRVKSDINVRLTRNQEAVSTLLASFGEDVEKCSENFARQNISFKDLASLTEEDLILLGITNTEKQQEILENFKDLPKQNQRYEDALKSDDYQTYNSQLLSRVSSHIDTMKTSISATDLKLKVVPSGDVILDEKNFASKIVLEALDELKKITEEIEDRLIILEEIAESKSTSHGIKLYETLLVACLATMSFGIWYWKFR